MKYCFLLLLLLLALLTTHSHLADAMQDSPDSPGSPDVKQFDFKFFYPGTNMMTLEDIVSLAESALSRNMTIKLELVSSDAPISFTIKNCNEVILEKDIPSSNFEIYFDEVWLNFLVYSGRRRCSKESYDFTVQLTSSAATSGYFRFVISAQAQTSNVESFDGKLEIQQKKWEVKKYSLSLQELLPEALTGPTIKSFVILPKLHGNKIDLIFSKCDINPITLTVDGTSPIVLDSECLLHLELLSHLSCKEDSPGGRIDITVFSGDEALNGTLVFHVVDHTDILDYLRVGSLLVVVFAAFLSVYIALGIYFAWCKNGKKVKYIKKNPLLMRPLPPIPVQQEEIEMSVFIPKFITLSYHSEDYTNGSSEHVYESID